MSDALNRCCSRFREEIGDAEHCLKQVGGHLASAAEKGVDTLEADLTAALARCEAKHAQAAGAGKRIGQFIDDLRQTAVNRFEDWKTDREVEKIEKHADKMEQRAVDAIAVAACALLEAEVAVVDALRTRKMAIEVAG
jgi:hypothetical protein